MKKIKSVELNNFAGFTEFRANLNPGVTYLVGKNGAGKTTVGVTSIFFILKGIAERGDALKGERFRFIGPYGDSATGSLVLKDDDREYVISRKITKSGNQLEIVSSDGAALDQAWIDSFWNELFVSPLSFARMSGKEQALMLGIDVSEFDKKDAEIKEEAKFLRREIKEFGEIKLLDDVPEAVVMAHLLSERDRILEFNNRQDALRKEKLDLEANISSKEVALSEMLKKADELREDIEFNLKVKLGELPEAREKLSLDEVNGKIENAEEINRIVAREKELADKQKRKDEKMGELQEVLDRQSKNSDARVAYLQGKKLPFSNLTINDDGGLLLKGRPIQRPHFSTGELIKICSAIIASQNPEMKYIFIEDFDLLDYEKAEEILNFLTNRDFQVVCEKVSRNEEMLVLSDIDEQ